MATFANGHTGTAWSLLQDVLASKEESDRDSFLDWSILPFISALSSARSEPSFVDALNEVVSRTITGGFAVTSLEVAEALLSGMQTLDGTTGGLDPLISLQTSLLAMLKSETEASQGLRIPLAEAYLHALAKAWPLSGEADRPALSELSDLFVISLSLQDADVVEEIVTCWNATYGLQSEALAYPADLVAAIQKLLDRGVVLSLPGWPEVRLSTAFPCKRPDDTLSCQPEPQALPEATDDVLDLASASIPFAAMVSESLEVISESTAAETQQKAVQTKETAKQGEAAMPAEEAETTIMETQSTQAAIEEGNTTVTSDGGNDADISHLTATQAMPALPVADDSMAAKPASQADSPRPEPTRSESPIPRLSQIPDIPDMSTVQPSAPLPSTSAVADTYAASEARDLEMQNDSFAFSDESSTDVIPETQYVQPKRSSPAPEAEAPVARRKATDEIERPKEPTPIPAETQTTRVEESFNESVLPRRMPVLPTRKSATPEVVIVSPRKAKAVSAAKKGKGRAIRLPTPSTEESDSDDDGFTLVAANRSRPSLGSASDTSRISNTSNEASRRSTGSSNRSRSKFEVVIPYRADIPRPWKDDPPTETRKVAKKVAQPPANKPKHASSNVSNLLKQANSSSFVISNQKASAGLKKTASVSLTMTRKPGGPLRSTVSLPTIVHESSPETERIDDSEEDDIIVTSSPENRSTRVKDVSDSLILSRKRKLRQAEEEPPSSSPTAAAHRRRSSMSQGKTSPIQNATPSSTSRRSTVSTQDIVESLCDATKHELAGLLNKLPQKQQKLMHRLLGDTLRVSKKARHA